MIAELYERFRSPGLVVTVPDPCTPLEPFGVPIYPANRDLPTTKYGYADGIEIALLSPVTLAITVGVVAPVLDPFALPILADIVGALVAFAFMCVYFDIEIGNGFFVPAYTSTAPPPRT